MRSYRDRAKAVLDRYMDDALTSRAHIGLSFGLLEQEQVTFWNYGFSDANGQKAIQENSFFEIASNTKVFTALLFAQLMRKGFCSHEDFHQGSLAGSKSTIFFSPELQRGLAYFSNTPSHKYWAEFNFFSWQRL